MPSEARIKTHLKRRARKKPARPYHHGRLKEALVEAALALAEEAGAEGVTMREAARRAGVSSAAPFRHFPDREALMSAAAAEALRRFRLEIDAALGAAPSDDPLMRLKAFGLAYLRWALRNPAHFHIISTRAIFDLEGDDALRDDNAAIISMVEATLVEAARLGRLRSPDAKLVETASRALVYGFARMFVDGHFPRWGIDPTTAESLGERMLDLFIDGIAREPEAASLDRRAKKARPQGADDDRKTMHDG
jgi:AcrR family transcriptional regulator